MALRTVGGWDHSLFVDSNGSVYGCGDNTSVQIGINDQYTEASEYEPPHKLKKVLISPEIKSIACGERHSLFLAQNGTVWTSGHNASGQMGKAGKLWSRYPVQIKHLPKIAAVSCGAQHSLFLDEEGSVWVCGNNTNAEIGVEGAGCRRPTKLELPHRIIEMACGPRCTVLIDEQRTLWAGGESDAWSGTPRTFGLLLFPNFNFQHAVTSIACGDKHIIFLCDDHSVWSVGKNDFGQLGVKSPEQTLQPIKVSFAFFSSVSVIKISAGAFHSLFLGACGTVWSCGKNEFGELGHGNNKQSHKPKKIKFSKFVIDIGCGKQHSMVVDEDQNLWTFGFNEQGQLALPPGKEKQNWKPQMVGEIKIKLSALECEGIQIKSARCD